MVTGRVPLHAPGKIEDDHGIGGDGREEPLLGIIINRPGLSHEKHDREDSNEQSQIPFALAPLPGWRLVSFYLSSSLS